MPVDSEPLTEVSSHRIAHEASAFDAPDDGDWQSDPTEAGTVDVARPAEAEPEELRIALNRPVSLSAVQSAPEARRSRIADATTHVGPPIPSSSSD